MHGGIGMTDEFDIGHLKRAWAAAAGEPDLPPQPRAALAGY